MPPEYPLFLPPPELASRTPREWTRAEAEANLEWLKANLDARVGKLLDYLGEGDLGLTADALAHLGSRIAEELHNAQFSTESHDHVDLTNRGYALAADSGLLVAKMLIRDCNGLVQWDIVWAPKDDMSFQRPVLTGFGRLHLDPIAGSIGEAFGVLRGKRAGDAWAKIYQFWRSKVFRQ